MTAALASLIVLLLGPGDVQWNGISHVPWQDRRPLCPVDGESFALFLQSYRFDLTAVRVFLDDGATQAFLDADFDHDRGPYAVWRATVPATAATARLGYWFELRDGADVDYYSVGGMSEDPPSDGGFVVDFGTLEHAPLGATRISDGGAVFRVWAPTPTVSYVRGQFNNWTLANPMTRLGNDFIARIPNAADRHMYKFYFQPGNIWKPDARARALNPADNYNSFVEDPLRYPWSVPDFPTPPLDELIVYEMHVGTFAGRNDPHASGSIPATYLDVAAHVQHFVDLGINAVELMPITEFPTDFGAGYNPITAWAPEWRYGTPDQLKWMIDVLHQHGIAVILDIVWNHLSPTDNYLWFYDGGQIYFDNPSAQTPWGSQADFDRPEVRDYYAHSALYWLHELHVDGFRMDGTDFMDQAQPSGWGLMQRFNDELDNRFLDKMAIAEQLPDDPWVTRPTALGGAGFDSQWHDAFNDQLRSEILDAAFGDPEMWRIRNIILGSGQYLEGAQVVNYLESHDEVWPSSGGQRLVKTIDPTFPHDDIYAKGRIKLAQGVVMFAPGVPMFFMGSEWLEDTDFRGGRSDGADRIDWSKRARYANIFRYFKDIIAVRRANAALRAGAPREVFHVNEAGNVIAFHRWDPAGNDIVVIANFSNTDYTSYDIGFPQPGTWYELINSQALDYDGNGLGNAGQITTVPTPRDGYSQSASVVIPQMGLLLFRYNHPPTPPCPGDVDGDRDVDLSDLGIVLADFGCTAGCAGDTDVDGDTDLSDLGLVLANFGTPCGP